jgi:hypothetical protein
MRSKLVRADGETRLNPAAAQCRHGNCITTRASCQRAGGSVAVSESHAAWTEGLPENYDERGARAP